MMSLLENASRIKSGRKALGEVGLAGSRLLMLFSSGHTRFQVLM